MTVFPDCDDPMINGPDGTFKPSHTNDVDPPGPDGFTPISFPPTGPLVLTSPIPAELTEFILRINQTCMDGSILAVEIVYYGPSGEVKRVCRIDFYRTNTMYFNSTIV